MHIHTVKYIVFLLLLSHVVCSIAGESTQQRIKLETIDKLLNESSVSENIMSSNSEVAIQYYKLAKTAYGHAVEEFKKGDITKSNLFIKKATDALSDATMFANMNKKDINLETDRHHYIETKESVDVLLEAVHRVAEEKGIGESEKVLQQMHELNKRAEEYASNNNYTEATRYLEQILSVIRSDIAKMKTGDTLVRTLTFASPKDEFRYEIDRNDAHFLLLKTFFTPQQAKSGNNGSHSEAIKTAYRLRKEAESYAESQDYKQAIGALEKSTTILITIIRTAGNEIPG